MVRLLAGAEPRCPAERMLVEALSRGPLPLAVLVDRVVDRQIGAESSAADPAIWGPSLFARAARDLIERLDGTLVRVESPTGGRLVGVAAA